MKKGSKGTDGRGGVCLGVGVGVVAEKKNAKTNTNTNTHATKNKKQKNERTKIKITEEPNPGHGATKPSQGKRRPWKSFCDRICIGYGGGGVVCDAGGWLVELGKLNMRLM